MPEIKSVTVHCPKCLHEFEIKPVVKSIDRVSGEGIFMLTPARIVVKFEDFMIAHTCKKEEDSGTRS